MTDKMIAVLGAGNGAHTMAGDLALRGYRVRMYEDTAFIGKLGVLRETLAIHCTGVVSGVGKIEMLTDDICQVINGVKYIAVALKKSPYRKLKTRATPLCA